MGKIHRNFAVAMILFLTFSFFIGNADAGWPQWIEDVYLSEVLNPYKDLVLRTPESCQERCLKDPECDGWTYIKPGLNLPGIRVRGPRCLLMKNIPSGGQYSGKCCISGMKTCAKFFFISTSPIPSVVIGGNYNYKIQTSGGYKTVEFCPVAIDPRGAPSNKCDNSPGQRFSMPPGLTMDKSGVISGQVKCWDSSKPFSCAGYQSIKVKAWDSCPWGREKIITKEFFIDVKANP